MTPVMATAIKIADVRTINIFNLLNAKVQNMSEYANILVR